MYAAAEVLLLDPIAAMEDAVIPGKLLTYMAAPCRGHDREQRSRSRDRASKMRSARSGRRSGSLLHSNACPKNDPELRRVLGANAHVYAETHFTKASVTNLPRLRSLNLLVGTIFVLFRILVIVFCSQIAVLRHCNLRPHRSPREETEWP